MSSPVYSLRNRTVRNMFVIAAPIFIITSEAWITKRGKTGGEVKKHRL